MRSFQPESTPRAQDDTPIPLRLRRSCRRSEARGSPGARNSTEAPDPAGTNRQQISIVSPYAQAIADARTNGPGRTAEGCLRRVGLDLRKRRPLAARWLVFAQGGERGHARGVDRVSAGPLGAGGLWTLPVGLPVTLISRPSGAYHDMTGKSPQQYCFTWTNATLLWTGTLTVGECSGAYAVQPDTEPKCCSVPARRRPWRRRLAPPR
jgi:hypothetical protein